VAQNRVYGLCDMLSLCSEEIEEAAQIKDFYSNTIRDIKETDLDIIAWKKILVNVWSKTCEIEKIKGCENLYWNSKCRHSIGNSLREMQKLFPWIDLIMEAPDQLVDLVEKAKEIPMNTALESLESSIDKLCSNIEKDYLERNQEISENEYLTELDMLLKSSKYEITKLINKINKIKEKLLNMADCTDFSILYDKKRGLFAIGYDIEKDTLGSSYYDLLASESRQASFVAIAKGDVEQKHWFKLSRAMTLMGRSKGLVSWSGTMFEYFMPLLIMKNYPDTLLNETYRAVIDGQKRYCSERRVP